MADYLDAPTILRSGAPTLGVPVLSVDYRPGGAAWPAALRPSTPTSVDLDDLRWAQVASRLRTLESTVAVWALPWYTKCWRSLRGLLTRAAQRWHAPPPPS